MCLQRPYYDIARKKLSRPAGLGAAESLNVKFLIALERPRQDGVELLAGQPEVGADLLFGLFGDVVTREHLAVPLNLQFADQPAHEIGPFLSPELFEWARLRVTDPFGVADVFLAHQPPRPAHVIYGEIARDAADEPGEPFGLAHLAL